MSINSKIINSKVGFFDNLYTVAIGNHQVLYNPYSYKGKLVINRSIYLILKDLLSSKRTYKVILDLASKKLPQLKKNDVEAMINGLDSYDLLSFNNEKNFFHYNPDVSNKLLVFWIDITNQCNFECTYCFVNKKKEIIDPVKLEELLERLGELRNKYCFTKLKFVLSGGEPLLYFKTLQKVVEAIDNFQKKNINTISIEKSLITNGTLLTDEKALYLKKNNISANISLDGLGQFNNMTRKFIGSKKDTFPYIMKGVKIAQKHNILDCVATTVTSKNIMHLPDLTKFFLEEKIKFQFQFYKEMNQFCAEKPAEINSRSINSYLKAIKLVFKFYDKIDQKKKIVAPIYFDEGLSSTFISEQGCSAGNMEFTITQNCEIKVCPASEVKVPYNKAFDFIASIKKINEKFVNHSVETNPTCKKCLWKYVCKGGCRLEMIRYGKLGDLPPRCYFFKKIIPLSIKLEAKRIVNTNIISYAKQI